MPSAWSGVTPREAIVVAADVAVKAACVVGRILDRFCGTLILTGGFTEVMDSRRKWYDFSMRH